MVAIVYVCAIGFRLIRFVVHKRQAGVKTGTAFFEGMPCPGTAYFVLDGSCLIEIALLKGVVKPEQVRWLFLTALVFVTVVTVSKIKYAHFGRVFMGKDVFSAKVKAVYYANFVVCLLLAIFAKMYIPILVTILATFVLYSATPLFADHINLYKTKGTTDNKPKEVK